MGRNLMGIRALALGLTFSFVLGFLFTTPQPIARAADNPSVTAPASAPTFDLSTSDQDPGDFVVSGFGSGDPTVSVAVGFVDPPTGTSFRLPVRTDLEAAFGYNLAATAMTEISFSGKVSDVNAALAGMTVSTGANVGNITIRVTASKTEKSGVFYNPINGHFYQFVQAPSGIVAYDTDDDSTNDAIRLAEASTLFGLRGYLATITSAQEQAFIFGNVDGDDIWLGASDAVEPLSERIGTFSNQTAAEGKWYWISGPEAVQKQQFWNGFRNSTTGWVKASDGTFLNPTVSANTSSARYENWCLGNAEDIETPSTAAHFALKVRSGARTTASSGEPNGTATSPTNGEQYLLEKWGGRACWNDWGRTGDRTLVKTNYLVEYSEDWGVAGAASGSWNEQRGSFSSSGTDLFATSTLTALVDRAPKSVQITPGSTSAAVSWTAPSSGTVTGYTVTSTPGSSTCTATPPSTSCEVTGLVPFTEYEFEVEATFSSGDPATSLAVSSTTKSNLAGCQTLTDFDEDSFDLRGNASVSSSTVELTPNLGTQAGAIWSSTRVSLSSDFCVTGEVYLGSSDAGADGLALVLQPSSTSSLSSGGGLGYAGINPSFSVELDTYTNAADPTEGGKDEDHIALMKDGATGTHNAWGANPFNFTSDIEDGNWRRLSLEWDASESEVNVYFDGVARYSGQAVGLSEYFSSSSGLVYWGFTAATGGAINQQQVRNLQHSGAPRVNSAPSFVGVPTSRTVLLDAVTTIDITLSDDLTSQGQWQAQTPILGDASVFAVSPSFSITGPSSARLSFTAGSSVGSSSVALTVVDADGATATHTMTVAVATSLPVTPQVSTNSRTRATETLVTPTVALPIRATTPPQLAIPAPQSGPVLLRGVVPIPPKAPMVVVGGEPTVMTTNVPTTTQLDVRAGQLNLGVKVQEDQGEIFEAPDGTTEIAVRKGAAATITGSGFRPGATVQVFMPLAGDNAKELTRIPVQPDGSFDGSTPFATRPNEAPLPIGKNVLQLVSLDNDGNQVVVEMTVNIAQGAPAPEQNRIDGVIPTMAPGQSVATSGGEPVPVRITPVAEQKLAVVEGDGWSMAVNVAAEDGGVEPSEGGALLKLVRNESALVSGSGFMPGTRADVWLFSDPTLLGTVTIDENGEFTGEVNIDPNMIPVGEHTLQLQGVGEDGYIKAANMGVLVDDPVEAAPTAVEQGLGLIWWIIAALVLLAVIVVLIASRRRREA